MPHRNPIRLSTNALDFGECNYAIDVAAAKCLSLIIENTQLQAAINVSNYLVVPKRRDNFPAKVIICERLSASDKGM